jgi:aspartyl-tRNA(Asn)/glutamyl-tRNA(Gln) amidotransferase subunit C
LLILKGGVMKITREEVAHVATLARLSLQEEEKEQYARQLDHILSYIEKLNELNTDGVEPTSHSLPLINPMREDVVKESLTQDAALSNAPEKEQGCFKVPRILSDG